MIFISALTVRGRGARWSRRREPRKGGTEKACWTSCASPGALCPRLWFLVISTPHLLPWVTNLSIGWIPRPLSLLSLISLSFLDSYPDPLLLWITARVGEWNYKDLDVLSCAAEHDLTVEAYHTTLWKTLINFLFLLVSNTNYFINGFKMECYSSPLISTLLYSLGFLRLLVYNS